MIAYIQGEVFEVNDDNFVILTGGIGYRVYAPVAAIEPLPQIGEQLALYTHQYVREDICMLFGFSAKKELALFNLLLGVNGVGAKTALAMLNTLSYGEIVSSLQFGNALSLTKISGVGKKTAERIVLELGDKIKKLEPLPLAGGEEAKTEARPINDIMTNIKSMAISALTQLGYTNALAVKYVEAVCHQLPDNASLESIITTALKEAATH